MYYSQSSSTSLQALQPLQPSLQPLQILQPLRPLQPVQPSRKMSEILEASSEVRDKYVRLDQRLANLLFRHELLRNNERSILLGLAKLELSW